MTTSKHSNFAHSSSHDSSNLFCLFLYIYYLLIIIAINQNLNAFLRVNILSFQVNNNHPIDLINVKTQVELKEKHRYARDSPESKISTEKKNKYITIFLYLRTSTS